MKTTEPICGLSTNKNGQETVYESRNIFFNPNTAEFSEVIFKIKNKELQTSLGREIDYEPVKSNNYYI